MRARYRKPPLQSASQQQVQIFVQKFSTIPGCGCLLSCAVWSNPSPSLALEASILNPEPLHSELKSLSPTQQGKRQPELCTPAWVQGTSCCRRCVQRKKPHVRLTFCFAAQKWRSQGCRLACLSFVCRVLHALSSRTFASACRHTAMALVKHTLPAVAGVSPATRIQVGGEDAA